MLARSGPAAGMGRGPRVPAGAPSSSPTWPRACTLEREPARARRVGGRLDEAGRAPSGPRPRPDNPFARGAAPPDGHQAHRRRSTSSSRPRTRRAADTCARSGGCSERALAARPTGLDLMRVGFEWSRALGGSLHAGGLYLSSRGGPRLSRARAKILVGRLRAGHVECEQHAWAVAREMVASPSEIEQATAMRMVARGCACE